MNYAGTPSFCTIAPISCSHLVSGRKAHLVLAHLMDKTHQPPARWQQVEEYIQFIRNEKALGAFIMMDNSAYELKEPYAPARLLELAKACEADAIVLPDYPFQPSQLTVDAAKQFAPIFKQAGFKTFFVPQSTTGDKEDWIAAYKWASESDLVDIIGISILGVPNAWNKIDTSYARVVAMQSLIDSDVFNPLKHHHFLGLNTGPALEIPSLLRMGVLDTIDSSGPVWAAINGHMYTPDADSYQTVRKLTNPVDFFLPCPKDARTVSRVAHNMNLTDRLFDKKVYNSSIPWYAVE